MYATKYRPENFVRYNKLFSDQFILTVFRELEEGSGLVIIQLSNESKKKSWLNT